MEFHLQTCEFCGQTISLHRKEAIPETRRCYGCSAIKGTDMHYEPGELGMDKETYGDLLGAIRS